MSQYFYTSSSLAIFSRNAIDVVQSAGGQRQPSWLLLEFYFVHVMKHPLGCAGGKEE